MKLTKGLLYTIIKTTQIDRKIKTETKRCKQYLKRFLLVAKRIIRKKLDEPSLEKDTFKKDQKESLSYNLALVSGAQKRNMKICMFYLHNKGKGTWFSDDII